MEAPTMKTKILMLKVPVRVRYTTDKAKRDVLTDLKRELYLEFSSDSADGSATAKTLRPEWIKAKP